MAVKGSRTVSTRLGREIGDANAKPKAVETSSSAAAAPTPVPGADTALEIARKAAHEEYEEVRNHRSDDYNMDYCGICGNPGTLICCETCPGAYHIECLGFERVSAIVDDTAV